MPSRSLADISQGDWVRACHKLGLIVETKHGKGSHVLICRPNGGEKYTIQCRLHKLINQKIFRVLQSWGFSAEEIWKVL